MELAGAIGSAHADRGGVTAFIDRWIYVGMALMLIGIVLTGFVPDSLGMFAQVAGGERPDLPLALHVHAVLMGGWMLLLLAQTVLMATGHDRWHMQLGIAGLALAPAILAAGLWLVPVNIATKLEFAATASPEVRAAIDKAVHNSLNIALGQIRVGLCFALFVAVGLMARVRDPATHKRLMILATVTPMGAAFARIPGTDILHALLWVPLAVLPMFVWDLYRLRHVQRAWWWFIGAMLPSGIVVLMLRDTPGWISFASWLLIPPA